MFSQELCPGGRGLLIACWDTPPWADPPPSETVTAADGLHPTEFLKRDCVGSSNICEVKLSYVLRKFLFLTHAIFFAIVTSYVRSLPR